MPTASLSVTLAGWVLFSGALCAGQAEGASGAPQEADAAGLELFESRVRPLLLARCGECHGPEQPKGGLDLSRSAGWLQGGDLGPALLPGDVENSLLIRAVRYGDPDLAMPPRGRLSPAEIRLLEEWVAAGAPAPAEASPVESPASAPEVLSRGRDHWAFQAIEATEPPPVPASELASLGPEPGPIDRFLAQARAQQGLVSAARADRRSLARRASQVLTGLYPEPAELAAYLDDPDSEPVALERYLERLFASPHYGEHMARQWLDLVRYADSNGLDENLAMGEAWRYRDWVVEAFNQRWGYDRFVRAQLAGDLLAAEQNAPEAERFAAWTATGFLLLGPKMLAEQDQEKMAMDIVDEQIDVISKTFLGLTVSCARCHDHKFDPISARDYYALAGILRSTDCMESLETVARWRERELISAQALEQRQRQEAEIGDLRAKLAQWREVSTKAQRETWHGLLADLWLAGGALQPHLRWLEGEAGAGNLGADDDHWGLPEVTIVHTVAGGEQRWSASFPWPVAGPAALMARYASGEERPMSLALNGSAATSPVLGRNTGGFYPDQQVWEHVGNFELSAGEQLLELKRDGAAPHLDKLVWLPLTDRDQDPLEALATLAGQDAQAIDPQLLLRAADWVQRESNRPLLEPLLAATRATNADAAKSESSEAAADPLELNGLSLGVLDGRPAANATELAQRLASVANGIWRRAERARSADKEFDGFDDRDVEAWRRALEGATGLFHFGPGELPRGSDPVEQAEGQRLTAALAAAEAVPKPVGPNVLCVQEGNALELKLHVRGSHLSQQGEPIPRGTPEVFLGRLPAPQIPAGASGRLQFADWLLDPRHPLTARVLVNRLWQQTFGVGLVESSSNFGLRGAAPSHPELLDWLAQRMIDSGWSIQAMQKELMLSAAFAQTSQVSAEKVAADPENRWLARYARQRLSAESLRDGLLAAAGRLDRSLGGSLLETNDRDYVTNDQSANLASYEADRRALYLPIVRNAMYGFFASFDYADPSLPIERRSQTTVPAQALHLLNSPLAQRAAQGAAEHVAEQSDPIAALYQRILLRAPSSAERKACEGFLEIASQRLGAAPRPLAEGGGLEVQNNSELTAPTSAQDGDMTTPSDAERTALVRLANVLLASSEFLYFD